MILRDHTEYLACPRLQCLGINSRVVSPQGLRGDITWGWVFTIHVVVNLTDGLPPHLRHPDRIGRPLGLRGSTFRSADGPLVPVGPGTIARSFPLWVQVDRASQGSWFLTSACGGQFTALVGVGGVGVFPPGPEVDDSPLWLGGGRLSTLARGGWLSTLVQDGSFSTLIRGWLGSVLSPLRGSHCRSLSSG